MYRGKTQFRSPVWLKTFLIFSALLVPTLTFIVYRADELSWVILSLFILSVMMAVAVVAVFTDRFDLCENEISIRHNFRRSSISRASIESVTWAGGVGVSLTLKDGSFLNLPDIGLNSQSVCNSVRAWVKAA